MTEADLRSHERALVGQYGLFVRSSGPSSPPPTLSNGHILGIYMGALLRSERDADQVAAAHPDYERYLLDVGPSRGTGSRVSTYSGAGTANGTGFANTALLPAGRSGKRPDYDRQRINAMFVPYAIRLTDNQGKERTEYISVLVGLDNLRDGDQVLVDYGR